MKRLQRKQYAEQSRPMLRARNICYEMSEKAEAIDRGGIGAFHCLAYNTGLIPACETSPELRFCPDNPLDRAMAAYMMVQAKGLVLP